MTEELVVYEVKKMGYLSLAVLSFVLGFVIAIWMGVQPINQPPTFFPFLWFLAAFACLLAFLAYDKRLLESESE